MGRGEGVGSHEPEKTAAEERRHQQQAEKWSLKFGCGTRHRKKRREIEVVCEISRHFESRSGETK
jgi:hypothetical protein